jgi:hypothetical protein
MGRRRRQGKRQVRCHSRQEQEQQQQESRGSQQHNFSGPNLKRKTDNIVAAIQHPAKDNSKKTSGGFKDLLKEKCL